MFLISLNDTSGTKDESFAGYFSNCRVYVQFQNNRKLLFRATRSPNRWQPLRLTKKKKTRRLGVPQLNSLPGNFRKPSRDSCLNKRYLIVFFSYLRPWSIVEAPNVFASAKQYSKVIYYCSINLSTSHSLDCLAFKNARQ